jgi:hypothetical protein
MEDNNRSREPSRSEAEKTPSDSDPTAEGEPDIIDLTERVEPPAAAQAAGGGEAPDDMDEIIDLQDIVAPAGADTADEDIIDLTQVVAQVVDGTSPVEADDDIIELAHIVKPEEMGTASAQDAEATISAGDEDLIELTDVVDQATMAKTLGAEDTQLNLEDDEPIDLTEVVDAAIADVEVTQVEDHAAMDDDRFDRTETVVLSEQPELEDTDEQTPQPFLPDDSDVIRLDDVLNRDREPMEEAEAEESPPSASDEGIAPISLGMPLDEVAEEQPVTLTGKQIEAAIERLIQNKYSKTLEELVAAAVEKAVTREIESIRRSLMEDDDQIE